MKHATKLSAQQRRDIINNAKESATLFVDLSLGTNLKHNIIIVSADVSLFQKPQANQKNKKLLYRKNHSLVRKLPFHRITTQDNVKRWVARNGIRLKSALNIASENLAYMIEKDIQQPNNPKQIEAARLDKDTLLLASN